MNLSIIKDSAILHFGPDGIGSFSRTFIFASISKQLAGDLLLT